MSNDFDDNFITSLSQIHDVKSRDIEFESAVGENVKSLREKLGWSQAQLAAIADLEPNQIHRVESAKNTTSLAIITTIAKALGKQPYELLKTGYQVKVNDSFDTPVKEKPLRTTDIIIQLLGTSFLNTPRSVDEVINHCNKIYHIKLRSSPTSGALKKLTDKKILRRVKASIKGRYLYRKK